ncbi:hypothetical protein [Alteromonas lipotrueae]|uniref:hypothetical protein n=1 Tax=Alteromonas lipotrueae TaxID=2803814 RepID=UPI001C4698D2|nr:hypothetical protein [Alteromonas lipotrueae]
MKYLLLLLVALLTFQANAASDSSGKVKEVYSNQEGALALKLDSPFSEGAVQECPQYNGFAGVAPTADPILKSMLLAAFSTQKRVKLVINGCNGNWLNIQSIFVYEN